MRHASESPDRFGPELGFGNRLSELTPGRTIALIKHAQSGSDLFSQWNPGKDAADREHFGPQFRTFVETVELGLKGLRERGYDPAVRGMVWQQGESDGKDPDIAAAYGANLAHFIARVREQFGSPGLVFVYGYVMPPPNQGRGRDLVRKGHKEVAEGSGTPLAVKGAFVVASDDLSQRAWPAPHFVRRDARAKPGGRSHAAFLPARQLSVIAPGRPMRARASSGRERGRALAKE